MLIIGGYPVQVLGQVGQLEVVNKEVLELLALISLWYQPPADSIMVVDVRLLFLILDFVYAKKLDPVLALIDGRLTLEGGPCTFSTHERFLVAKSGLPFRLFGEPELLRLGGWQIVFVRLRRLRPLQEV
jgi:hypothetical protein